MKNCHQDMLSFHNDRVTLPDDERTAMRERRDTNRVRLKEGLTRDEEPAPTRLRSQGSYAMRTMVQDDEKDYDIDDGVYFDRTVLEGPQGGERSTTAAKEMVRKAVHDDRFNQAPEVRTNCVRVFYDAGYHVDLPVYRITYSELAGEPSECYELASADWRESDPGAVTAWFSEANSSKSPSSQNGGQLRRMVRLLKCFSRSRSSWKGRTATGFMITKLVDEQYLSNDDREDTAVYDVMKRVRDRLDVSLEVDHPTIAGEKLTKGPDDAQTRFFREKLGQALTDLAVLFDQNCSVADARAAWDKVFNTDFFGQRGDDGDGGTGGPGGGSRGVSAAILIKGGKDKAVSDAVDKRGGGKYA